MKLKLGGLSVTLTRRPRPELELLWGRSPSYAERGYLRVSTKPLWLPMYCPRPTKHSRRGLIYWAYWRKDPA